MGPRHRPAPERGARRQRAILRPDRSIPHGDRDAGVAEPVVQFARRADRQHSPRSIHDVPAQPARRARPRELPGEEGRRAAALTPRGRPPGRPSVRVAVDSETGPERLDENLQIETQTPALDVIKVALDPFLHRRVPPPPPYLGPPPAAPP